MEGFGGGHGASSDDDRATHERSPSAGSSPTVSVPCVQPDDLKWSVPANLRWLNHNRDAGHVPAGCLAGQLLDQAADMIEGNAQRIAAVESENEDLRNLMLWTARRLPPLWKQFVEDKLASAIPTGTAETACPAPFMGSAVPLAADAKEPSQ